MPRGSVVRHAACPWSGLRGWVRTKGLLVLNRPGMSGDFIDWKDEVSWHVPQVIRGSCVSALSAW